ncbi:MAG TPA: HAMP domain-containing sensor histidine kinase [Terracidiphilus sp.]|jgi:signal transduction histidine kinase
MSASLMPHAVCWNQDPPLIWTMAVTNTVTFLSYFSICATLLYLARKTRRVIQRDWVFFLVGFALFIVACGSTHLLEVITTWYPIFWVDAWTNIITAILSGYIAVQFIRKAPELSFGIDDYAARLASTENEKAQVEESLLAARKLEEWNRMSAVVTHEINNPLAAIQNLMFLVEITPGASPETIAIARQAAEEVRRIEALTRSTLGFFRQTTVPEKVDLRSSTESVRLLLEPLMRKHSIELEIRSVGDCVVNAIPVETRQVLLNLVRNACEATSVKGAKVSVFLSGKEDAVEVVVADEGSGIGPEMLATLFQFGSSTKGDRGNGMGLWVVKQLIEKHGGTIDLETEVGKGTRFTVVWPRVFPAAPIVSEVATVVSRP